MQLIYLAEFRSFHYNVMGWMADVFAVDIVT
jgi:hypothetical protein